MTPRIDTIKSENQVDCTEMGNSIKRKSKLICTWPQKIHDCNLMLTRFWRHYGVKISFFFSYYYFWSHFTDIATNDDPNANEEDYSKFQTFWLYSYRIVAMFIVNFTLPGIASLLLYTAPSKADDEHTDEEENERIETRHDPVRIILRIVTRGDYPKLIKDNLEYHEHLFKKYWKHEQDEIEFHVATETQLKVSRPKKNGTMHRCEVKEYYIPPEYKTPNNTLYKARNSTFVLDRCVQEANARGESFDRIWVIAIDEDVFLTRNWLLEFDSTVLDSKVCGKYKFVNSPSRPVFVDQALGIKSKYWFPPIVPFFGETFRFAMDISRVWWQAKLFGRSAVGVRGSCYAIRLDVESRIGYDCGGPFLSIGDDTTFFHRLMLDPEVKLQFMGAWFLEGAPNSALAFMKQRARWVRNYLYFLIFAKIPALKKVRLASFLICWTVIMPCGSLICIIGYIMMFADGRILEFFPAGAPWPIVDAISCLSGTCVIYWYIYGCALLLPWYWAILVSLTFTTYAPVLPLHFIGAVAAVWGLLGAFYELASGAAEFGMTEKHVN